MRTFRSLVAGIRKSLGFRNSETVSLIARLFSQNFGHHWRKYVLAILLMATAALSTAGSARIIKDVVDEIFVAKNLEMLVPLSLGVIALSLTKGFASYFQEIILGRIGNQIVAENQRRIYERLLSFGLEHFTARTSSSLIMVVTGGANAARDVLNVVVLSFGRDFLTLVALLVVMLSQAPALSLVAIIIAPLAITGVTRLVRRVRHLATAEFALGTRVIETVQETVHGAQIVKVFNLNDYMRWRMNEAVTGIEYRANGLLRLQALSGPLMETLGGISIGLVTLYSGWATIVGGNTPGDFMAFVTAFLLAYEPAKRLARLHVNLETNMIGVRAMFNLLDELPGATEDNSGQPLRFDEGTIEFRNVEFWYRPEAAVLRGVSFRIHRNSKVALVGPSGGGKSTILSLIPRLYDPRSGEVLIDGQDIRRASVESVRSRIALVSQNTFLFGGTVRDNIRLGRPEANDLEVEEAARNAHAHEFIAALAHGYDTSVGENGVQLSGGQRQRIAIARALLKQAPIILLDEATSSLDSDSERQVQLGMDRLMEGRTIVVIAHRLSTVVNADRILVIDHGRVVEEGTHAALLELGGVYERFCRHQFAAHEAVPSLRKASADAPL